ncbi:hypothetical protein QZM42_05555 [Burkholderia vietnamiensis]|uniref:hypothetical protein n=1 Tax=Burkholderia vietnamiensis TaxID=60552 RepID=UPI002654F5A7|nr:hypothetical protein [Burkholderia vietnamiensis]MDN7408011.1 hypothetical protein [Burkholderia vietnamiensis]
MLNLQPATAAIASLHPAAQAALLLAVILLARNATAHTLRLHRQGYLRTMPTVTVLAAGGVAGYFVGGEIIALATAISTANVLIVVAGMRRGLKAYARAKQHLEAARERLANL